MSEQMEKRTQDQPAFPVDAEVKRRPIWARIIFIVLVLGLGLFGMMGLAAMRDDPRVAVRQEAVVNAVGMTVTSEDVQTEITGYGTARPLRVSSIGPEVAGRVISVHPSLRAGLLVKEGEVLFTIDPVDYRLVKQEAQAEVRRLEEELKRMEIEEAADRTRLSLAKELLAIAQREFDRVNSLVGAEGAESLARLDVMRAALRRQEQAVVDIERNIDLYPPRREQTEAQLASARSRLALAEENLARTEVKAPFTGRVETESVEVGQRLAPGTPVVTIADDSVLEIRVSLDSEDVSRWLGVATDTVSGHWFAQFTDRPARVIWTECPDRCFYPGELSHIESFDAATRTFQAVVRVRHQASEQVPFPFAAGMFAEVVIPGEHIPNVIRIPREAIDSGGNVLLSNDGRLKTQPVEIVRFQGDAALISGGLKEGDILLTTRPPEVIDGMKVNVKFEGADPVAMVADE